MDFLTLPSGPMTLLDVTVPGLLIGQNGGLVRTDLAITDGRIGGPGGRDVAMQGALVLPTLTDMHTHLDKGHIQPRQPNPDGTFAGAIRATATDRTAHWSAEDIRARAGFALRCAYAHGTAAIRTHLDSSPPQDAITWPVFAELRAEWAGRIDLQGVCLVGCESVTTPDFARTADLVAEHGGVLGMATYPVPGLRDQVRCLLDMAGARGLSVDLHVDETLDPGAEALRAIAEFVLETGFDAPVVVGHCCSLAAQDPGRAGDTLDLVARAGLHVVSLPMCNLYLQDRQPGRTPRVRGITLVHEMRARGIPVAFASDNTRDPFYGYGDLDMLEVLREATRIGQLDHAAPDWFESVCTIPARACGFGEPSLETGAPADLVIFRARNWNELLSRPQADRIVLRRGRQIDRRLPDFAELDHLMKAPA